jgi:hypothetical protein
MAERILNLGTDIGGQLHTPAALPPGEGTPDTFVYEAGLGGEEESFLPVPGIEPRSFSP